MSKITFLDKANIYFHNKILRHNISSEKTEELLEKIKVINDKNKKIPSIIIDSLKRKGNLSFSKKLKLDSTYLTPTKSHNRINLIRRIDMALNFYDNDKKTSEKFNLNLREIDEVSINENNLKLDDHNENNLNVEKFSPYNTEERFFTYPNTHIEKINRSNSVDSSGYMIMDRANFFKEINNVPSLNAEEVNVDRNEEKTLLFKDVQMDVEREGTKVGKLVNMFNFKYQGKQNLIGR